MAIKSFKPYTPSRRNMTVSAFDGVDKKAKPERSLLDSLKKAALGLCLFIYAVKRRNSHVFSTGYTA